MSVRSDTALRAGIFVFLGISILIGAAVWFQALWQKRGHHFVVEFTRAMGLQPGSEVMVQGIRVGVVDEVRLRPPATVQVVIRMERSVPVYYPPASEITIRVGALLGRPYVDITNRRVGQVIANGDVVRGVDPVSWEELVPQAHQLAQNLNELLGNPQLQRHLQATLEGLAKSAQALQSLLSSVSPTDVQVAVQRMRHASERLAALLADRRLDIALSHVVEATASLSRLLSDPYLQRDLPQAVHEIRAAVRSVRQGLANDRTQRDLAALAANLRESSEALKKLLSEGGEVYRTLGEAREALAAVRALVSDAEVQGNIKTAAKNFAALTAKGQKTMDELDATLVRLRQFIEGTQGNLQKFAEHLRNTAQDLDETLDAVKWLVTEGGVKENLRQVAVNLRESSENIKEATQAVRDLIKDERTQSSLREGLQELGPTIKTVRVTAEQGRALLNRLQAVTRVQAHPDWWVWWHPETDEWRSEAWLAASSPASPLALLGGAYTDRRGTRLNLQIQREIAPSLAWRFGVRRSKLGVGARWGTNRWGVDVDAFDPDRWQVNAWLYWRLSPALSLRLGLEDLGRNRLFGVGVSITYPYE
ncbi:hypothetical protein HRbin17_00977 [bacterium HR17]|uniref:Mce/MlaD domain-containing protein n=1 Tax=Candidatus Fervidibacter japonicus TaxID=2035412 RepID=A0A2H5XBB9_9BACT|nr:hypothetical protein HRbin17_00977 [bacterium HR17]